MFIKQIEIRNFKSYKHLCIDLQNFNVLIGGNASGKSNFVAIFDFLRNIARFGLKNAIPMAGGVTGLLNTSLGLNKTLYCKLTYLPQSETTPKSNLISTFISNAVYEFELQFHSDQTTTVVTDQLTLTYEFLNELTALNGNTQSLGVGEIVYKCANKQIQANISLPQIEGLVGDEVNMLSSFQGRPLLIPDNALFLETPYFWIANENIKHFGDEIAIYDIDTKFSKQVTSITGKTELEDDTHNLTLVLRNILADSDKRRVLLNLVNYLLPFVEDIKTEQVANGLLLGLQEEFSPNVNVPASLLSEGTIEAIAIVVILYFSNKSLIILEEPNRYFHPHLIQKILELMGEATADRQIIMTTHNPQVVQYTDLDQLLLVSRDKQGFSQFLRVADSESVPIFMQNEIGIQDLYVQDLLGV